MANGTFAAPLGSVLSVNGTGDLSTSTWAGGTGHNLAGTSRVSYEVTATGAGGTNMTAVLARVEVSDDAGVTWKPIPSKLQSTGDVTGASGHSISVSAGASTDPPEEVQATDHSEHDLVRVAVKAVAGGALAAGDTVVATGRFLS